MSYNYWPRIYQWVPHGRKRSRRADHGDDKAEDIPMWRLGMNIYIDPNNINNNNNNNNNNNFKVNSLFQSLMITKHTAKAID